MEGVGVERTPLQGVLTAAPPPPPPLPPPAWTAVAGVGAVEDRYCGERGAGDTVPAEAAAVDGGEGEEADDGVTLSGDRPAEPFDPFCGCVFGGIARM